MRSFRPSRWSRSSLALAPALALAFGALALAPLSGCGEDPKLAPKSEALSAAKPKSEAAVEWAVQGEGSTVRFEMQAPFEKQDGTVPASALSGTLHIDPTDLRKSTGLLTVDIGELEIFMQKAEEKGEYGERIKDDTQNEHMRDWLEIGDDAPDAERAKNRAVQFSLLEVTDASATDLGTLSGAERTVTLTANGEFLLHQHKVKKTVKLSATFHYEGDKATGLDVKTVSPFAVALPEHDVRPRTGFGKLAKKTLGALADKVGEQADVTVEFSAIPASK